MNKIIAIAVLTIRSVVRSRVFAAAAAAIAVAIIGLPFVIRGDGTPESRSGIFVNYAFGLLMTVLSLTATWCGAGAISLEVSGRQMQLVITKPLRAVQIWTGKLLGLITINLLLLMLGGILICGLLHWIITGTNGTGQNDLRRKTMTVYRTVPSLKAAGAQAGSAAAVGPGQSYRWRFDLRRYPTDMPFALLKFRFIPSPFAHQSPVTGTWRAFRGNESGFFSNTAAFSPHMPVYLNISRPPTPGLLDVEYLNRQTNPAVTLFFPSENDLYLLMPEGSFEANLLRGLIMAFARLTFFTSLGMLAGALFSFPVGVFAAMGLLIIAFSGGLMRRLAERGLWTDAFPEHLSPLASILNEMARASFRSLATVLPPLDRFDPLAFLPDNLFIPWSLAGQSIAVLCGLYPLILLLIGAACLSRREIALSSP